MSVSVDFCDEPPEADQWPDEEDPWASENAFSQVQSKSEPSAISIVTSRDTSEPACSNSVFQGPPPPAK
eukprot:4419912-Pyramimonas_sp.AAC.1